MREAVRAPEKDQSNNDVASMAAAPMTPTRKTLSKSSSGSAGGSLRSDRSEGASVVSIKEQILPEKPDAQTEEGSSSDLRVMLMEPLRDKHAGDSVRWNNQLRPEVKWPHLDDSDHYIETLYEEFEEIIGLANDGRGMNAVEKT